MSTAIVIVAGMIIILIVIFIGYHKTRPRHLKLEACWKSLKIEMDQLDEPTPRRSLDAS